jgi:hypothetical protein
MPLLAAVPASQSEPRSLPRYLVAGCKPGLGVQLVCHRKTVLPSDQSDNRRLLDQVY